MTYNLKQREYSIKPVNVEQKRARHFDQTTHNIICTIFILITQLVLAKPHVTNFQELVVINMHD